MAIVTVAGLVAACGGDDGAASSDGETGGAAQEAAGSTDGPVDLSDLDDAIQVTPTLDDAAATTATIGLEGGTVTATGGDGTTYTLTVPPDSMRYQAAITMTPLSALDGLPFGEGPALAVDLQPSGLVFDVPAVLAIDPATPIPAAEQIPITYQGTELTIARPVMDSADIDIEVPHFSGYGVAKGLLSDIEEARKRLGGSAEDRIGSEINAMAAEDRARQLAGGDPLPDFADRLRAYLEQYRIEVVDVRIAAAGESCATGRLALTTYLEHDRTMQLLLGEPDSGVPQLGSLFDTAVEVCMQEEYEMCVEDHVVHRVVPVYLGFARTNALLGVISDDVLEAAKQKVEDCLRFELEFSTTGGGESNWSMMNVRSEDSASFTAEAVFDADAVEFARSSGDMESAAPVYEVSAAGCSGGTPDGWRASADFVGMAWTVGGGELDEDLGHIEELMVGIELPDAAITLVGMTCGGTDAGPVIDHGVSAPRIYRDLHGDQMITEWTIVGGETFATAEWEIEAAVESGTIRERGTATLTHTPR